MLGCNGVRLVYFTNRMLIILEIPLLNAFVLCMTGAYSPDTILP